MKCSPLILTYSRSTRVSSSRRAVARLRLAARATSATVSSGRSPPKALITCSPRAKARTVSLIVASRSGMVDGPPYCPLGWPRYEHKSAWRTHPTATGLPVQRREWRGRHVSEHGERQGRVVLEGEARERIPRGRLLGCSSDLVLPSSTRGVSRRVWCLAGASPVWDSCSPAFQARQSQGRVPCPSTCADGRSRGCVGSVDVRAPRFCSTASDADEHSFVVVGWLRRARPSRVAGLRR